MTYLLALLLLLGPGPPRDGTLADQLARSELSGLQVACAVQDVDSGQWLYRQQVDLPLAPASNLKLLTTAAALARLGPDHVMATRFLAAARPDAVGALVGDLVVLGGGDPCLRADALAPSGVGDPAGFLADLLVQAGLRSVQGALVLDDGLFRGPAVALDWPVADLSRPYAAPVAALSIHGNCLTLAVDGRAPSVSLLTNGIDYRLEGQLQRARSARTYRFGRDRPDASGRLRVWGSVGSGVQRLEERVAARDANALFARCLLAQLLERGVSVRDGWRVAPGAAEALSGAVELVRFETPVTLALLLANKESDNSMAEHLAKLTGARAGPEGSFDGAGLALRAFLSQTVETPVDGLQLRDGSGLSPANRVTARALVATLVWIARQPQLRDVYLRSLPSSGQDGSLHQRLEEWPYRGAVRAKTGWITGVSALSGYARTRQGRTLAFSILFNGVRPGQNKVMKGVQDDLCRAIVDRW